MSVRSAIMQLLIELLSRTPLLIADGLVHLFVWVWWLLIPVRKEVGLGNVEIVFPAMPRVERERLLRRAMHDIALGYVELLHVMRRPEKIHEFVRVEGGSELLAHLAGGGGCLGLCGHAGSWDIALLRMSTLSGLNLSITLREPRDPWAARLMKRVRSSFRVHPLAPHRSKEQVYQALSQGHVVLFPMDQRHDRGILVPFFGREARTGPSLAAIARRSEAPVFRVWSRREGRGRHVLMLGPVIEPHWTEDRERDILEATRLFNEYIEERILDVPHGWLWLHRRWG